MNIDEARVLGKRSEELAAKMGGYFFLKAENKDAPFWVYFGKHSEPSFTFSGNFNSFEEGIEAAEQAWVQNEEKAGIETIRKMALALIDIGSQAGKDGFVTQADLRMAGFTNAQIDAHGAGAILEAGCIVQGGPFCIVLDGEGNQ